MISSCCNIENFFKINNDILINYENKEFPALPFKSELHVNLAFTLQDPQQALVIHLAYEKHLIETLTSLEEGVFSKALLKICYMFGSAKFSPEDALLAALQEEGEEGRIWLDRHQHHLKEFIQEANKNLGYRLIPEKKCSSRKVLLLTTSASGGNDSVTKALKIFLDKCKEPHAWEVSVIDVETIAEKYDPMKIASGITYDGIYNKIVQQANQLAEGMRLWKLCEKVARFIPHCQGSVLKDLIREIKPDVILSTRNYTMHDISLAYSLGIPLRMIHCDYEMSAPLLPFYGKIHPELIKWWFPSLEARIFKPLFEHTHSLHLYDDQKNLSEILEKIAFITKVPLKTIQNQFELLGYPTLPEIQRITDTQSKEILRAKWKIKPQEHAILVEMGKYGVGILEEIFYELRKSPIHHFNIKYIFVCGHNGKLKEKLQKELDGSQNSALQRCEILGLLNSEQINELRNIALFGISKPGGATTAEAIVIGMPLLLRYAHPWEEGNGKKLERLGLAYQYQKDLPLWQQVENCVKNISSKIVPQATEIDWQKQLLHFFKMGFFK